MIPPDMQIPLMRSLHQGDLFYFLSRMLLVM